MKRRYLVAMVIGLVIEVIVFTPVRAQSQQNLPAKQSPALHQVFNPAISPDGRGVVYIGHRNSQDTGPLDLVLIDTANPQSPVSLLRNPGSLQCGSQIDVDWSPAGDRIVVLGTDTSGQTAVFLADPASESIERLCVLNGGANGPRWSPDGKTIAMLYSENLKGHAGPIAAGARDTGVIDQRGTERRIALLDPSSHDLHVIGSPDLYVHEFSWAPDSRAFAAVASPLPGDNNWYVSGLYRINVSSGEAVKLLTPEKQIAVPRWSPDGTSIAFLGGLMSDEGLSGGDIFTITAEGGQLRNLTPGILITPCWLRWTADSRRIQFSAVDSGAVTVAEVDIASLKTSLLWHGEETLSAQTMFMDISVAHDDRTSAVIRQSFDHPPELWIGTIGSWRQATHLNTDVPKAWGRTYNVRWKSDTFTIQGWLTTPAAYDSTRLFPMVIDVHGGPMYVTTPKWPRRWQNLRPLTEAGYCVFQPNIRGSMGCGEAFARANVGDIGYGDFRDILAGADEVVKRFKIDSTRVGITGWSYGGYMTMWAVTQTHRFCAAVAAAGISNWFSYYAQAGISRFMLEYFGGVVYDIPELYNRSAPMTFIKQATTPTLIVAGEKDQECPAPQSFEFWKGLQYAGVKTQLIVYPDAGHGLVDVGQIDDFHRRLLEWMNEHMQTTLSSH